MGSLHTRDQDVDTHEVFPKAHGKFTHGDAMTVASWTLEAGCVIPEHKHPHEQIVNCISGEFRMTVEGDSFDLSAGDSLVIPSGRLHSGVAVTEVRCIDVFTPVREDYRL